MRVVILQHAFEPNVVPVFARLATTPGIDLDVLFASRLGPYRHWSVGSDLGFRHTFLPGLQANLARPGVPFTVRVNPTIVSALLGRRPDVVVSTPFPSATSLTALVVARLSRRPFVLDIVTMETRSAGRSALAPVLRAIVRQCSGFLARSTRTVRYLISLGAPPERIVMAPYGVNAEGLWQQSRLTAQARAELRASHGIRGEAIVLFAGRLDRRKGLFVLLEAFADLERSWPGAALVLAGTGPHRTALEALCRERGLQHVHFLGAVPHQEMPRLYGLADVLVLPSVSTGLQLWGAEVWGFVVAEAMACGVPCVVTDRVGCADDLVEDGVNGLVVPEGEPASLAAAMRGLLADEPRRRRLADAARQHIGAFGHDAACEGYRSVIAAVIRAARAEASQ